MHQTTLRFTPDLWEALELECRRLGISAAQYLREAALARLSYTAGQRGDVEFERALINAGAEMATTSAGAAHARQDREARAAREDSSEQGSAAAAVSAQSEHVRRRSQEIRAQSAAMRRQREERESEQR